MPKEGNDDVAPHFHRDFDPSVRQDLWSMNRVSIGLVLVSREGSKDGGT